MTEYIKKYSSKKETVTIHWDTAKVDESVAFSKPMLTVEFDISNSSEPKYDNQGYILRIDTDIEKLSDINELLILNDPIYSNIQGRKMADLENSSNIYADLDQSAYTGRPRPFPYNSLLGKQKNKIDSNESVKFNF
ncbi:hypothetical protein GQR36_13645 [Enterococcus termitis]